MVFPKQVIKSVISLLNYYGWNKFSIIYEDAWKVVAKALKDEATKNWNKTVTLERQFKDREFCCYNNEKSCCNSNGDSWYDVSFIINF
jgi:guanylate cyclase, other